MVGVEVRGWPTGRGLFAGVGGMMRATAEKERERNKERERERTEAE